MSPNSGKYYSFSDGVAKGYGDSWKNIISSIYDTLQEDGNKNNQEADFLTFEDGYRMMSVIDKISGSERKKQWVDIPEL
jgi:hypothetical protein